jgi:hypothetical protein
MKSSKQQHDGAEILDPNNTLGTRLTVHKDGWISILKFSCRKSRRIRRSHCGVISKSDFRQLTNHDKARIQKAGVQVVDEYLQGQ